MNQNEPWKMVLAVIVMFGLMVWGGIELTIGAVGALIDLLR